MIFRVMTTIAVILSVSVGASAQLYVSAQTGNNGNDGSKGSPVKNIQKAIDMASDGATIYVAEGNYFGMLNSGNINITKPVKIYGGYSSDFAVRDVLKHLTLIQPSPESNGTQKGQGTMQVQVKSPKAEVVVDGLIFDRGNSISYNAKGEGKPDGVESAMMQPIGTSGVGGENLVTPSVFTTQTAQIYIDNAQCNLTVANCAFINAPNYGIRGMFGGEKATITNCVFINNRMAAAEITKGAGAAVTEVYFTYNTVLFMWARLKDMGDMGYGYRYMTRINSYVTHNIIGLSTFSGLDRTRVDSDRNIEAARITTAENNIFFLNKQSDLTLPGGGNYLKVKAEDFSDVAQLAKSGGNKTITDPKVFKGIINEPYLNGFLTASYKEKTDFDPNSPANTFRQAMGMNMVGTMQSSATMYANRYPWREALKFFGAIQGFGAQRINN